MRGWVSPLLGVRFDVEGLELVLTTPEGERFRSYEKVVAAFEEAQRLLEQERQRAEAERLRAEQLAQKLRELGVAIEEPPVRN